MSTLTNTGYNPFEGIENPDRKREREELDNNYEKQKKGATPEKTAHMKAEAGKIFGNNFTPEISIINTSDLENGDPENDTSDLESLLDSDSLEPVGTTPSSLDSKDQAISKQEGNKEEVEREVPQSESPYTPILRDLKEDGHINDKVYKSVLEELHTTKSIDEQQQIMLKSISNLLDKGIKQNIEKSFQKFSEQTEITEENFEKSKFFQHATNLNINLDQGVGGLETMLAKNFISLPKNGETNDKRDINRSMDITLNSIISKNGEDFRKNNAEIIINIKAEKSIESKYQQLKNLYKQDLLDDAKKGGKKGKEDIRQKKEGLQQKAKKMAIEFKESKNIQDSKVKVQKIQELEDEKAKIIAEGRQLDGFEQELYKVVANIQGLGGGDNDKSPEKKLDGKIDKK